MIQNYSRLAADTITINGEILELNPLKWALLSHTMGILK